MPIESRSVHKGFTPPGLKAAQGTGPYGSRVLQSLYRSLADVRDNARKDQQRMEHPRATEGLRKAISALDVLLEQIQKTHSECYPNSSSRIETES